MLPVTIIDYGMGNLASIANMLKKVGAKATLASTPQGVYEAQKLILPGVGAFDHGMKNLKERNLIDALHKKVLEENTPVLGICLGAQLLTESSEEGILPGLGWIKGKTVRFNFSALEAKPKIPHMGWNRVRVLKPSSLFEGLNDNNRFYFVHSFHIVCTNPEDRLGETVHGISFTSSVERQHIKGAQFHPEKSHFYGMQLLRNFAMEV